MDMDVSNGTCYYTENSQTKGDFIPCGNAALAHWPCCHSGDMCLGYRHGNACWDADTGNTYVAGCTDAGFHDRACPFKPPKFHKQEWVAMQQCGGSGDQVQWGGCAVDEDSTKLERLPNSSCDPYCSETVYNGQTAIPAFASLPDKKGGSIVWTSGFDPISIILPPTVTSFISSPSLTTSEATVTSIPTNQPQPTSTTSPAQPGEGQKSEQDEGLSTGTKVGIGIGSAAAALLVVAVVLLAILVRRRRKKNKAEHGYQEPPEQTEHPSQKKPWSGTSPDSGPDYAAGFKSELDANEPQRHHKPIQPQRVKSELPADPSFHDPINRASQVSPFSSPSPHSPYQAYDGTSTFSDGSTLQSGQSRYVSPQSTGTGDPIRETAQPGGMHRISELQG